MGEFCSLTSPISATKSGWNYHLTTELQQNFEKMEVQLFKKVELLATECKVEKERRRKMMESLQRNVEDRFQKSHEQYFEEQLQREGQCHVKFFCSVSFG